jgi:DNA-directed RNA polymerase subunit omega
VETSPQEKPLSIALREINTDMLTHEQTIETDTTAKHRG